MTHDVITTTPETTLPTLQDLFLKSRVGALPVVDRDKKLVGIASRSDVVRQFSYERNLAELAEAGFDPVAGDESDASDARAIDAISVKVGRRLARKTVADIMIRDIATIEPEAPVSEAARRMIERRIHRLPVVENGTLIGIVSAFDFMRLHVDDQA